VTKSKIGSMGFMKRVLRDLDPLSANHQAYSGLRRWRARSQSRSIPCVPGLSRRPNADRR
jgi:hypothetical protein